MVDFGKVIWGLGLFLVNNLIMYLVYPLFNNFMTSLTSASLGDLAMGSGMEAVSWGGFVLMYALLGWIIPLYLFIKGVTEN